MRQRKKSKTGERAIPAQRKHVVLSSREFTARRKEDALALAQLAYDMFIEQEIFSDEAGRKSSDSNLRSKS